MKFWRELRWRIVAVNILVALVAVAVVLLASSVITRTSLDLDTSRQVNLPQAGSDGGASDRAAAAELLPLLRQHYFSSLPAAIILALISSLLVGLLATYGILYPLRRAARRSRRIASGLYIDRLALEGEDELATLASSFNQMAEILDQVEQRRIALVGYLSHELRTPLSGVSGYIEGIMDGVFPDTDATLALMYGEVRRMRRLVDDLQVLSRVQSGQVSLRMGTFELSPFVERATVKLAPQWITCGIDVLVEPPRQAPVVFADPDRVDQILLNILANSLANTPEGGKVTVGIVQDGGFARVDICDNGNGISEEEMPYIFERYYRSNSSRDSSTGSGIGLTISRHLAWAMGGELTAQSDGPGKGSTFSVLLPVSKSHVTPSTPHPDA